MKNKNTKIVCTLGPSSDSITEIEQLVKAGMNVARLNFSHGTYKDHKRIIANIKKVEKKTGQTIGILQDLQGPKIRVGEMPEKGIKIKKNQTIVLTITDVIGEIKAGTPVIPVQYKNIVKDVKKGDIILIEDGLYEIQVLKKNKSDIIAKVKVGGIIKSHKGINIPTASISAPCITEKDKKDLKFGLKYGIDFVALSFVRSAKDIKDLRKLIEKEKKDVKIIAKIERHEAIKNIEEIIKEVDAIMIARGDLGIEIPAENVPVIQKNIIRLANIERKPVITATQVLQSMVENPRPTRAEVSDAANAVYDHTDAIMLSNESAVGLYAQKAVAMLTKVSIAVEQDIREHHQTIDTINIQTKSPTNAICKNATELAEEINATYIIAHTKSGYTAKELTKSRTFTPIITITPSEKVSRELTLIWGLNKTIVKKITGNSYEKTKQIIQALKKEKLIKSGDRIVIVSNANRSEKYISTYNI